MMNLLVNADWWSYPVAYTQNHNSTRRGYIPSFIMKISDTTGRMLVGYTPGARTQRNPSGAQVKA
jgi:hypothetical protein